MNFPESDWKVFKRVRQAALQRFCARILKEVAQLVGRSEPDSHHQYLSLYKLVDKGDDQIADAFNDFRRSTAFTRILIMKRYGMLTDEELAQFSQETRKSLDFSLGINER